MKGFICFMMLLLVAVNLFGQDQENRDREKQSTVFDVQRNALYLEFVPVFFITGYYEKVFPVNKKSAFIAGAGIMQGLWENTTDLPIKLAYIRGGTKNYFECGTLLVIIRDKNPDSDLGSVIPLLGYRRQSPKGFLFRGGLMINVVKDYSDRLGRDKGEVQPGLQVSVGYSF